MKYVMMIMLIILISVGEEGEGRVKEGMIPFYNDDDDDGKTRSLCFLSFPFP